MNTMLQQSCSSLSVSRKPALKPSAAATETLLEHTVSYETQYYNLTDQKCFSRELKWYNNLVSDTWELSMHCPISMMSASYKRQHQFISSLGRASLGDMTVSHCCSNNLTILLNLIQQNNWQLRTHQTPTKESWWAAADGRWTEKNS